MELHGKRVTVIGLGNSGVNAALLAARHGAKVFATDAGTSPEVAKARAELERAGITVETGRHTEEFVRGSDLAVVSPGVEDSSPAVRWAEAHGVPVIGEMELGYRFCEGRIIAITGTNGKSTVTTLIGDILKDGGADTVVCGNIGNSLCGEVSRIRKNTWVVLEVSSAQLERTELFNPRIAIILNITDDHMDRYKAFRDYFDQKLKIFRNQTKDDALILNYDASNLRPLRDRARSRVVFFSRLRETDGAFLKDGGIWCVTGGEAKKVCAISDIPLKGVHNIENVLAGCLAGTFAGVGAESMRKTIRSFRGLRHRFETVGVVDGVEYIDDSKGTTVDSTKRAIESCSQPVVLIAGGKDKFSDYRAVRDAVKQRVRHLVLIGEAAGAIRQALGDIVETHEAKDMDDAVSRSRALAKDGWVVLLSPMCSSFDMYKNYKQRGEAFRNAVGKIVDSGAVRT